MNDKGIDSTAYTFGWAFLGSASRRPLSQDISLQPRVRQDLVKACLLLVTLLLGTHIPCSTFPRRLSHPSIANTNDPAPTPSSACNLHSSTVTQFVKGNVLPG